MLRLFSFWKDNFKIFNIMQKCRQNTCKKVSKNGTQNWAEIYLQLGSRTGL